jgi:hypothetical protein
MKKFGVLGVWLFIFFQSLAVRGEVECIENTDTKELLCFELGGGNAPVKHVIKAGKGCGANSACGGNMRVAPDTSTTEIGSGSPTAIETVPIYGGRQGVNPAVQEMLRDKTAPRP